MFKLIVAAAFSWLGGFVDRLLSGYQANESAKREAVDESASETQTAVKETSDARADYRPATDADELISRLRERQSRPAPGVGKGPASGDGPKT